MDSPDIDVEKTAGQADICSRQTSGNSSSSDTHGNAIVLAQHGAERDLKDFARDGTRYGMTFRVDEASQSVGSSQSSTIEKELYPLPDQWGSERSRYLRYTFFSVYRRLFTLVFVANMAVFVGLLASDRSSALTLSHIATAASANIMVAILIRQEHVINLLYLITLLVPRSAPLYIRRHAAKIYCFGGVHSSTATTAVIWFILFTGMVTRDFVLGSPSQIRKAPAIMVITYLLLVILVSVLIFAFPRFRQLYHNSFEAMHRFAGWTALGMFWVQSIIVTNALRKEQPGSSLGMALVTSPTFWFLAVSTSSIILPWLRLRKRAVRAERLSSHATRLHFDYTTLPVVSGIRVSDNPMKEWHAFACMPERNGRGFSMIVSNAGDWTSRHINDPPKKLWVRGSPTFGVLRIGPLFHRTVVVATGSGIGPCLSFLMAFPMQCRVLWSTRNPLITYGQAIIDEVYRADSQAVIIDTSKISGRPDMVLSTYHLYKESRAEAVFVISNPKVTHLIVHAMETRRIPAYGPIFDS
ncbi:MAG: hypothetical protein M1827_007741 [Pycnora praestabilis]|nr:MAG: hypothetical protein M1827_007741 [Pycnora praestabilis]